MRSVLFTDLDGTLLDAHTYDWSPAREALAALADADIPVVLCTSKTRAEVEALRLALRHAAPFIVENGGAVFVPSGYFGGITVVPRRDAYELVEIGLAHALLVDMLKGAALEAGVCVRGWHEMDAEEIARRCEMTMPMARLAMMREYDEPFVVESVVADLDALEAAVVRRGARLTRGDRFFHIMGPHDKGAAARQLIELYTRHWGPVRTIAIGDAPNDVRLLALADVAIVVDSPYARAVADHVPGSRITSAPGPAGWNEAVLALLSQVVP